MHDDSGCSTQGSERGVVLCSSLTRTEQRSLIFHLLYVLDAFEYELSLDELTAMFLAGYEIEIPKDSEVYVITQAVFKERVALDESIVPLIENWRLDRLGVITKLILRLAVWELHKAYVDSAVAINEAVELAKCFGEKDSYKFINGVLDNYLKRA